MLLLSSGCKFDVSHIFPVGDVTEITVVGDRSEPMRQLPNPEVLGLYHLDDQHTNDGVKFRYRDISDLAIGDIHTLSVPPVSPLLSNGNERVSELKAFSEGVKQTFEEGKKNYNSSEKRSVVTSVIIEEANNLSRAHTKSKERYLVIFSDCLDHQKGFLDFYDPVMFDLIKRCPDQVCETIESKLHIEDLSGLKVIIVYQPPSHDYRKEEMFQVAKNFYTRLLTRHGAEVVFVPDIKLVTSK